MGSFRDWGGVGGGWGGGGRGGLKVWGHHAFELFSKFVHQVFLKLHQMTGIKKWAKVNVYGFAGKFVLCWRWGKLVKCWNWGSIITSYLLVSKVLILLENIWKMLGYKSETGFGLISSMSSLDKWINKFRLVNFEFWA